MIHEIGNSGGSMNQAQMGMAQGRFNYIDSTATAAAELFRLRRSTMTLKLWFNNNHDESGA
jgi:hypothetical protein